MIDNPRSSFGTWELPITPLHSFGCKLIKEMLKQKTEQKLVNFHHGALGQTLRRPLKSKHMLYNNVRQIKKCEKIFFTIVLQV